MGYKEKLEKVLSVLNNAELTNEEKAEIIEGSFPEWPAKDLEACIGSGGFCVPPDPEIESQEKICFIWNGIEWKKASGAECEAWKDTPPPQG